MYARVVYRLTRACGIWSGLGPNQESKTCGIWPPGVVRPPSTSSGQVTSGSTAKQNTWHFPSCRRKQHAPLAAPTQAGDTPPTSWSRYKAMVNIGQYLHGAWYDWPVSPAQKQYLALYCDFNWFVIFAWRLGSKRRWGPLQMYRYWWCKCRWLCKMLHS